MVIVAGLVLAAGVSAAAPDKAALGDVVPLSGYVYGSTTAYLFLTGPNLPVNGVALNDITARADQGGFTQVSVDSNDRWTYKWNTASVGGRLDEGSYTIWVVNGPNDRSRLSQAEYSTISITLEKPGLTLETAAQPGTLIFRSDPSGASVAINNEYRGMTPLEIGGFAPGTYTVTFSRFGYLPFSMPVSVISGKIIEVTATLTKTTGSVFVNTIPPGAVLILDGTDAGLSPVTLSGIAPGNHTINAAKEGFGTSVREVQVIAGETANVDISLEPAPVALPATPGAPGLVPATILAGITIILLAASSRLSHKDPA
jgi:hypothetical protein